MEITASAKTKQTTYKSTSLRVWVEAVRRQLQSWDPLSTERKTSLQALIIHLNSLAPFKTWGFN